MSHADLVPTDVSDALADLFTAAATAVVARLRKSNCPLTYPVQVPGITRNENGWTSTYSSEQRNVLAADIRMVSRLAPLLGKAEVTRLLECARLTAEAYSSTLPFEAFLAASTYVLIEPPDPRLRQWPEYESDPAGWTARAIIHPALLWHLSQLPHLPEPAGGAAAAFADDVTRFADQEKLLHKRAVALSGIDIREAENGELADGFVTIRELSDAEQGQWLEDSQRSRGPFAPFELPDVSLEVRMPGPRKGPAPEPALLDSVKHLLTAFQLHGYTPAGITADSRRDPPWLAGGTWYTPVQLPGISGGRRSLQADDLRSIIATAGRLRLYDRRSPRNSHDVALRRFATGAARPDAVDALLDFTIALESLLLPDDPVAGHGDLTYRFQMHGALYLSDSTIGPRELARQLRDIYVMRSRVVHGRKYPSHQELSAACDSARELAARGLLRGVNEGFPDADHFRGLILGDQASGLGNLG
jgi:Apea-like HEPN